MEKGDSEALENKIHCNQAIFPLALIAVLEILTYGRRKMPGNAVC